ncbi:MAG: hypothetical protein K2N48_02520 [Muribaculaceae bacterium]|nr:hypothetical protein [Muribaculaceae bacterium]
MTRYQKGLIWILIAMSLIFIGDIAFSAYAQQVRKREAQKKEETYTRPAPTKPIRPVIPDQNRYQSDKVFLEYADSLYKLQPTWNDTTEKQIVTGNVKFRQGSLWMFCDSAYYYPEINSLDAFGHIRMEQGDTLFVWADQLYYNGDARLAKLTNGPSERKVRLKDPSGELETDTLDYDVDLEIGYYGCGGLLKDEVNTLTSIFGQYNSRTKDAEFFYDVELINHQDNYSLLSDTLYYNTATHMARIDSPTDIYGPNDTIYTSKGWYNTQLGNLEMLHRSVIIHKDSLGRATTLEGDSIVYDHATRVSRAYQYRDITKLSQPTVITDTANKLILISAFGMYNDSTKEAFATGYPLLKEYSRPDTLYLRADTIFTYIRQDTIREPKFYPEKFVAEPFNVNDFEYLELEIKDEELMSPITKAEMKGLLAAMLAMIKEEHTPQEPEDQEIIENSNISEDYEDVPENLEKSEITVIPDSIPSDSVISHVDSLSVAAIDSIDSGRAVISETTGIDDNPTLDGLSLSSIGENKGRSPAEQEPEKKEPEIEMIIKEIRDYHVAKAYPRARFFNQDIQGVADTLEIYENDSLMYMKRKPVVWNEERQVNGEEIILHFNDTTVDHALLPKSGFMAEYVDEDFYNQLSGKKMEAWFEDSYLKRLFVDGNVQVIMLPMENDSSFNKLVDAESSYMTVDLENRQIEKIKMWPEVTGNTTPLFLVKRAQKYLPGFRWLDAIRPKRTEVDGVLRWDDELGEVPEALELYFSE